MSRSCRKGGFTGRPQRAPVRCQHSAVTAGARGGDTVTAEGLLAWLSGQPNVAAGAKRAAGVKGELDHFGALASLQALLVVLREAGHPGCSLVLDEVETLQRVRSDVREKGLNALRQLLDEIDGGQFPGLYLVMTGTPAFYDGPQGVQRLAPLAQRLDTDSPRPTPLRQPPRRPDPPSGLRLRYGWSRSARVSATSTPTDATRRALARLVDDALRGDLAHRRSGELGGNVGIAPRIFLKKLVIDVLDRVDEFHDFDPRRDYARPSTTANSPRGARGAPRGPLDDVALDV